MKKNFKNQDFIKKLKNKKNLCRAVRDETQGPRNKQLIKKMLKNKTAMVKQNRL